MDDSVVLTRLMVPFARLQAFVWADDLRELASIRRIVVFVLRVFYMLMRELVGGQLNLRAMSLVYTTLLSLVPLLAVSFSVLKGFGYHQQLESYLFNFLLEPLGPSGAQVAATISGFVDNVKVAMLGSVGFALLIYTVVALVQKIESAFNFIWQIDHLRPMSQRFGNYLSVITIGPVLVFTAVGVTAAMLDTALAQRIAGIEPFGSLMILAGKLLPYLLVCLAFTFVYVLIPNTRVQFRAALTGGVLAGVLWKITGWGFTTFIVSSSRYAAIYSSFAILVLLLIWMYLSWLILLVGSQIAYFVQHPGYMTLHPVRFEVSNRMRERLALQIMYLVAYHHYHARPAWTLDGLGAALGIPEEPVERMLRTLVDAGYLAEMQQGDRTAYLPLRAADTTMLSDLLAAVRKDGESETFGIHQLELAGVVEQLAREAEDALVNSPGARTLGSLVAAAGEHGKDASEPRADRPPGSRPWPGLPGSSPAGGAAETGTARIR